MDEDKEINTQYELYIKAIHVRFDCTWSPGSTISFHEFDKLLTGRLRLLYRKNSCPKEFQWKPRRPQSWRDWNDIVIESAKGGYERNDLVSTPDDVLQLARQAAYDRKREAHIKVKRTFSFGTSTTQFIVHRFQWYPETSLELSVSLEFASSDACLSFLSHDLDKLERLHFYDGEEANNPWYQKNEIMNEIRHATAPFAFGRYHAEMNAIQRGLSRSQFIDEYPQPERQVLRYQPSPTENYSRRCYLILHLRVNVDIYVGNLGFIASVDWSATTIPPTFPSRSNPFNYLNNLHLNLPPSAPADRDHDPASSPDQGDLTITISARDIVGLTGTNSISAGNSFTIDSTYRTVNINYIHTLTGDTYVGTISGSNVGGSNNINHVHQ